MRVGPKFLRDKISPTDMRRFTAAFDKLVALGCLPVTLTGTLYSFCKAYGMREPCSPPYAVSVSFPTDEEIRKTREILETAYERIRRIDDWGVMEVLTKHAKCGDPPQERKQLLPILRWYIDSLPIWWVPRKDILQSSAPIACSMYSKMVTGQFRYAQIAVLLECLGYRPNLKHQAKRGYSPDASDLCDTSLERNCRNFKTAYPIFCKQLEAELKSNHEADENPHINEFGRWVIEGDMPVSVFNELHPNHFDWSIVFPGLNPKKSR